MKSFNPAVCISSKLSVVLSPALWTVIMATPVAAAIFTCQGLSTHELLEAESWLPKERPPLALSPERAAVKTGGQVAFDATGGTPPYTFEIASGQGSGSVLENGLYDAPAVTGSSVVRVSDIAGNTAFSIVNIIDAAGAVKWAEQSPHNDSTVHAVWEKSNSGYLTGQSIQFYSDDSCLQSAGNTVSLSVDDEIYSFEPAGPGSEYSFRIYSRYSISEAELVSSCSGGIEIADFSALCPEGLIRVKANPQTGTDSDFCVAAYEMKCAADSTGLACSSPAVSQPAGLPWVNIARDTNATNAKSECESLGVEYHLITNAEWLTIARSIESNALNWSSQKSGQGFLNRGHTDSSPLTALAADVDGDLNDQPCTGTNEDAICTTTGFSQKRTHTLANGEVIWDLSGNVWEWVDWDVPLADKAFYSADLGAENAWREWTFIDTANGSDDLMAPSTWQPALPGLDSSHGIGRYLSGKVADPGAAERGGFYLDGTDAGIYALSLGDSSTKEDHRLGFRCTWQ